ncbi:MAG: mercury methylation ferredoxin HgcB [Thermodesulfobacteriota bacterium]
MKEFRYINEQVSLKLDSATCIGCGRCTTVCPHRVLALEGKKAKINDFNGCIECGACAQNCPTGAIGVNPGTGCAAFIIAGWVNKITGRRVMSGCC